MKILQVIHGYPMRYAAGSEVYTQTLVWAENSPLVIHEAQQVRVPVVAADAGGMAEYVHHEVNGLRFEHRSRRSLAHQMQRFVDDPALARRLGERGYVFNADGEIAAIEEHVREVEWIYELVRQRRDSARGDHGRGPWRVTFDTNPDTCNMRCVMCEEHSPHSPLQIARRTEGRPTATWPPPTETVHSVSAATCASPRRWHDGLA